jgi:hypothetical protein
MFFTFVMSWWCTVHAEVYFLDSHKKNMAMELGTLSGNSQMLSNLCAGLVHLFSPKSDVNVESTG